MPNAPALRHSGVRETKLRVLVVEDDDDSRELLGLILERAGYVVQLASGGHSALELAAAFVPHAVLTDLSLPDIDGFELGKRLRELPALKACRLVAVTGYTGPEVERRAEEAGFAAYVEKPFAFETVIAAVNGGGADERIGR